MSEEKQLAVTTEQPFVRASTALSQQLGLEPRALIDAIKTQFFKGKEATDAQLAVVVSTARELGLNPLIPGQLYPYPDRSGSVTIMLGPDGIYTLLANNKDIVAQKDGGPAYWTEHGTDNGKDTCTGFINHRTKGLLKKTIWVDEWVVSSNPNWQSRRHHMSEIRALKQAARMVIHGIPNDVDEQRIGEMLNVTPEDAAPEAAPRPAPKPRAAKGAAAVRENIVDVTHTDVPAEKVVEQAPVAAAPAEQPKPAESTPVPKPVESFAEAAEATKPAPKTIEQSAVRKDPRLFLSDGENIEVECEIETVKAVISNDIPGVIARVKGGFVGEVRDKAGATKDGDKAVAKPIWEPGNKVRLKLEGRKSTATSGPNVGKVLAWILSVEAVAATQQADTPEF